MTMTYIRKKQLQIKTKLTNRKIQSKTNTIEYLIKNQSYFLSNHIAKYKNKNKNKNKKKQW